MAATADIFSECVIHKILCYLSYGQASRMRILSKTWLQAWSTLPNLEFLVEYFEETKIVDAIMETYRENKIPIDKFGFSNCSKFNRRHQVFPLIDKWLDTALQNGARDLVYVDLLYSVRLYPFPISKVLAANSLRELVLKGCNLMHVSSSSGFANCHSLRKLSLSYIILSKNLLQTLLNSCPFIVSFNLDHCSGLVKIELMNLQKIKSVSVSINRNQHVKIQAPTLEHLFYNGYLSGNLVIVGCQNLKSLELSYVKICNGFLHNLISRSQSLEVLKIQYCMGIRQIETSNLVSLEYIGYQIPELKIAKASSQLKHSKIVLHGNNNLDAAWFSKLRKLLWNSASWSQVLLCFPEYNEIKIKDLQQHNGVACPQMDVLNVNITRSYGECPTFVDALLWSCNPRRLNLSSTVEMITCFVSRLMYMKNLSHSSSERSNPWHSQLKEIKVFDVKNQELQLVSGELAISTLSEDRKEVYFLLDWQCN
uniref:F-box family protein n=1 Tax=Solanum tuberosum TaxID=4113 RepID=M1A674_SOLTU